MDNTQDWKRMQQQARNEEHERLFKKHIVYTLITLFIGVVITSILLLMQLFGLWYCDYHGERILQWWYLLCVFLFLLLFVGTCGVLLRQVYTASEYHLSFECKWWKDKHWFRVIICAFITAIVPICLIPIPHFFMDCTIWLLCTPVTCPLVAHIQVLLFCTGIAMWVIVASIMTIVLVVYLFRRVADYMARQRFGNA
jgi:hypothetical protein